MTIKKFRLVFGSNNVLLFHQNEIFLRYDYRLMISEEIH